MKIGFDAKRVFYNKSGLGIYSRNIISYLLKYYGENEYFLFTPKLENRVKFEDEKLCKIISPNNFFDKKLNSFWRTNQIYKSINNSNIDIYHGLSNELPKTIYKTKTKSVLTIHDLIFIRYPQLYKFIDRKIYLQKAIYSCKYADKIIAISEQTKQDLIEFLKIDSSKIEIVYQGCHNIFKVKTTKEKQQEIIKKYNLPQNFILNVGTIEKRKNVLSVIKALNKYKIDIPLVIVGRKTEYYNEIQKYVTENKLSNQIISLQNISLTELPILYQASELFIYPSIFEGFGIPIIEALNSGVPVITSKNGCFSEAGGENSIYVEPTNIEEIANSINFILNNTSQKLEIIEKGINFVKKFDDIEIAKNIMEVYKKI